jgi:hypothetical protein
MKSLVPKSRSSISRSVARVPRLALLTCSVTATILLTSVNVFGTTTNHPPTVSWIEDQAITDLANNQFATVYFRAWDKEDPLTIPTATIENDPIFIEPGQVHVGTCDPQSEPGCPQDHGFKVTFDPLTHGDGAATIVIKATDAGGASAASSFTLRKQSGAVNPPVVAGIPNEQIQKNSTLGYGPVWFVVDDLDANGVDDTIGLNGDSTVTPSGVSDNHDVVADADIQFTPPVNGLRWSVSVFPNPNNSPGRAVITITFTDQSTPVPFKTSTSFVLDVIDTMSNAAPPSFTPAPSPSGTWIEHNVTQSQTIVYNFKVTDSQTPKSQLLVTATSSNANLVPNDSVHLACSTPGSTGIGTVTIMPMTPLPSPSPGVPQAATITLSVTDDAYTRRKQFLYVAKNPSFSALSFSRPIGVYNVNADTPPDHRPNDSFLTGEMRHISWKCIDNGDLPSTWDWSSLDNAFMDQGLPMGQDLSLNLIEEPCYIATHPGVLTWCDTSHMPFACPSPSPTPCPTCTPPPDGMNFPPIPRALPWDPYLQQQRKAFLTALGQHVIPATGHTVANEPLISIINCNLPGGDTGIRQLNGVPFSSDTFDGYTRKNLLGAVQKELRTVMQSFPAKLVQIGFFIVEDDLDGQYAGESLWHWLYPQLTNEFNGTRRPRVHFFQEDLGAARASAAPDYIPYIPPPNTTAYSFTPNHCQLPSFAFTCGGNIAACYPLSICPPTDSEYNNGITFQASVPWSSPFADGAEVTKTLNGTPNDGLEAAFNSYLNEYLEVYRGDLDHAQPPAGTPPPWDAGKWKAGLQSWKDYFDHLRGSTPLDAPAGVTVARESATSNTVSWYGVYRATCYTLQRKSLSPPGSWSNVSGCDPASTTCTDTASTGSRYAYRVQASNADGTLLSPWAQVAVFVSEGSYDGYVTASSGTRTPVPNAAQPGIQAGQGSNSDVSGLVSFDTSILSSGVTVVEAKLRLNQYTSNAGFDALGPCIVDIRKGRFNDNAALEAADFDAIETDMDVTPDVELTGVDSGNWVEAELDPDYISDINTTDRTQFRLWFGHVQGAGEQLVGWHSGESTGNEPHLVVQYTE